jgi:predicted DNA-binding transcriptional regulator AlpA
MDIVERDESLLKISEVVRRTQLSEATVRRLSGEGRLPRVVIGGSVRYRSSDVDRLIASGAEKRVQS